jgi:Ribbon-helix-helix protein, copG family
MRLMDGRKDESRKRAMLHVCVDDDTRHTLDALAYQRRETISELIREALASYLANPPRDVRPPPTRTITERIAQ